MKTKITLAMAINSRWLAVGPSQISFSSMDAVQIWGSNSSQICTRCVVTPTHPAAIPPTGRLRVPQHAQRRATVVARAGWQRRQRTPIPHSRHPVRPPNNRHTHSPTDPRPARAWRPPAIGPASKTGERVIKRQLSLRTHHACSPMSDARANRAALPFSRPRERKYVCGRALPAALSGVP